MENGPIRVAINGFGRIGKLVYRAAARNELSHIDLVAINDIGNIKVLTHLLRYDSTHGEFKGVHYAGSKIIVDSPVYTNVKDVETSVLAVKEIEDLPWRDIGIDFVVEATGRFTERKDLQKHLAAGAKKVILTAPSKTGSDIDITMVMGVNEDKYDPAKHNLISNASCTTNCLAPVAKILHKNLGIRYGWVSTTHAYTNDQRLLDLAHDDLRRSRAAAENFLPGKTGAAKAIGLVIPELDGKLDGAAWRVPVLDVSAIDLVVEVEKKTTVEEVNQLFASASVAAKFQSLNYTEEELVSSDYKGNPYSATVDAECTRVIGGNLVRVVAWYDNEWGYSCRVVDLIKYIAERGM